MTIAFILLLILTAFLWVGLIGVLATINSSDAAGNGLSQAYSVFISIGLWILLAIVLTLAGVRGRMVAWVPIAAIVLVPASCAAAIGSMTLLTNPANSRWPIMVPVLAPALITFYACWVYFGILPQFNATAWCGISIVVLSILPWLAMAR